MDQVDVGILNILRQDGRISNVELARQLEMTPSAALERVRKLERAGLILGNETRINYKQLGLALTVLIELDTDEPVGGNAIGFELAKLPNVLDVYDVSGEHCYMLKVVVADSDKLSELLTVIGGIPGVKKTRTTLVLKTIKNTLSPKVECE